MTGSIETTRTVRAACAGDVASLEALVERFAPWLLVQARHRLAGFPDVCEPEDLVHDVWVIALPRLTDLEPRKGRLTPVLVRFLSRTLLWRLHNLVERHLLSERRVRSGAVLRLSELPAKVSDALHSVQARERHEILWQTIGELSPREQKLIVMRGIEGHPVNEIASVLGVSPNTVSVAYRRACAKLRGRLDPRLLDDLAGP